MENKTNQAGSTHICTKCQRPREVGGGCYTSRKWAFQRKYRQHILNLINQIKHEQTLRRKGLRTQGIWIEIPKQ